MTMTEKPTFSVERSGVSKTLQYAFANKSNADKFLANPSAVFRQNGLDIPHGREHEFNGYFKEVAGDLVKRLKETPETQLLAAHDEFLELQGFGCTACKVGVYAIAVLIVAVGAGGLAVLTAESAPVLALASFAGVSARVALAFIRGLGAAVTKGVNDVATRICKWTHAC
jgi:hypothetical protein